MKGSSRIGLGTQVNTVLRSFPTSYSVECTLSGSILSTPLRPWSRTTSQLPSFSRSLRLVSSSFAFYSPAYIHTKWLQVKGRKLSIKTLGNSNESGLYIKRYIRYTYTFKFVRRVFSKKDLREIGPVRLPENSLRGLSNIAF